MGEKKKKRNASGAATDTESETETRPRKKKTPRQSADDSVAETSQDEAAAAPTSITNDKLKVFKTRLLKMFQAERAQTLSLETVKQKSNVPVDGEKDPVTLAPGEISAALEKMMNENQIMTADDMVFLI